MHLLVHYPPKVAVSDLVNSLKGVSARILRRDLTGRVNRAIMHGYFWPPSYFRRLVRRRPAHGGAAVHRATTPAALATLCGPFRLTPPWKTGLAPGASGQARLDRSQDRSRHGRRRPVSADCSL